MSTFGKAPAATWTEEAHAATDTELRRWVERLVASKNHASTELSIAGRELVRRFESKVERR